MLPGWADLPEPLLHAILLELRAADILRAGQVCLSWYAIAHEDYLWRQVFRRDFGVEAGAELRSGATSWLAEYQRLVDNVPMVLTELMATAHAHQVLHVSGSHNGQMFATSSKDGWLIVWNSNYPVSIKFRHDLKQYNWKHTQYSEFNASDTLILVSGVYQSGQHHSAGEIAVFSICPTTNRSEIRCRVVNRPFDIFGTWFDDQNLLSGDLHWIGHLISTTSLQLNRVNDEQHADHVPSMRQLYKFRNRSSSSIRALLVATILQPTVEAETAAAPKGKPACAKYLIFLTGTITYSPHLIGFKCLDSMQSQHSDDNADPYDRPDKLIDLHGHIVGVALSPDQRYLYVNARAWPTDYVVTNVLEPPPIAQEVQLHVVDLSNLQLIDRKLIAAGGFVASTECYFLFPSVSESLVASGSEDMHAYVWDRHYGVCVAKYPHADVVNGVVFNGRDEQMMVTVSDDYKIRVWRSRQRAREMHLGGKGLPEATQCIGGKHNQRCGIYF